MNTKYGWFSKKQAAIAGYCLYVLPNGSGTVRVSMTTSTRETTSTFDDIQYVGVVGQWMATYDKDHNLLFCASKIETKLPKPLPLVNSALEFYSYRGLTTRSVGKG